MKTQKRTQKKVRVAPRAAVNVLCYTRVELAEVLRMSARTVDRMIRAGKIVSRKINGRLVRIPQTEAVRLLNEQAMGGRL